MSEIVLYRKYRPKKFSEVVGQDHIVKALQGGIKTKNTSHAYLFCGGRGTGKTSIARILAEELGVKKEDLNEIDGASNRGINEIRAIKDAVATHPFNSPYKFFIIDEAHMLTKEAFNALLKTLEEPPSYVIFVLATTEESKMPETIISRCQTFQFKRPSEKIIAEVIGSAIKKEGFSMEKSSADLIALLSDGSFRDAYGILQKIIVSSKDKKISPEEVLEITGAPGEKEINDFIMAIEEENIGKGLRALRDSVERNIDLKMFIKMILRKMRAIIAMRYDKNIEKEIANSFGEEDLKIIKVLSEKSKKINSKTLLRILEAYEPSGRAILEEVPLELALFDIIEKERAEV